MLHSSSVTPELSSTSAGSAGASQLDVKTYIFMQEAADQN